MFYHYDLHGSTVALTDGNGNATDRIQYSAYGLMTCRTGTNDTPFLFNGRYGVQSDPNGLLYMRARYHNPYICRFLNPDPLGFAGGLNWYVYADGNPVSLIDPFGLCAESGGYDWLHMLWQSTTAAAGWAYDQAYSVGATLTAGLLGGLGYVVDPAGWALAGDPFAGQSLHDWAGYYWRNRMPAASAGWYDPMGGVYLAATIGTVAIPSAQARAVGLVDDAALMAQRMARVRELGAAGERMSAITGPKVMIPSLTGTANYRIPDELTTTYLREAKNVSELRVTPQLIDYAEFARHHDLTFILDVRQTTVVGPKAQQFIEQYNVQLNRLYPAP